MQSRQFENFEETNLALKKKLPGGQRTPKQFGLRLERSLIRNSVEFQLNNKFHPYKNQIVPVLLARLHFCETIMEKINNDYDNLKTKIYERPLHSRKVITSFKMRERLKRQWHHRPGMLRYLGLLSRNNSKTCPILIIHRFSKIGPQPLLQDL